MASAIDHIQPNNDGSSSYFQKTVCLYDWWLIKAEKDFEGKQLAIAGLTSRQGEAVRPFVSAPIVKRYDVFSLETADGIYIMLRGLINKLRCSENGFSPEVSNQFLFGFPRGWEFYALNCFTVELTTGIDSRNAFISESPEIHPEFFSSAADVENSIPVSLHSDSQEKTSGNNEKSIPEDSCNAFEMGWGNAAASNVSKRRSAGVQNIKICDQKKNTSGSPSKHPDKEQNPTSESLENSDIERLKSPRTPIQSRGDIDESSEELPVQPRKEINMVSKQLVGEVASSALRPLRANTDEGQNKRRSSACGLAAEKRITSSVPAGIKRKTVVGKDESHAKTGSLSVDKINKRSRSGRLLLPPLQFWRNQIPVYNVDHEIVEIREGQLVESPCRDRGSQSQKKQRQ